MEVRITDTEKQEIKNKFVEINKQKIEQYAIEYIIPYMESKINLVDVEIVNNIFPNKEIIFKKASTILWKLAIIDNGFHPIQSIGGMLTNSLSASDSIADRANAMLVAMEILLISSPFIDVKKSASGNILIKSNIVDSELVTRTIIIPLLKPTKNHKKLGGFNWKLTETKAVDKLNKIAFKISDCQNKLDTEPVVMVGNPYSPEVMKSQEIHNKWVMRQWIKKEFQDKKVYFDWAVDYRGRQYAEGYYNNILGNDLEKNYHEFANEKEIDFLGAIQLRKSIASAFDKNLSKAPDKKKLEWFYIHEDKLEEYQDIAYEKHTYAMLLKGFKQYKEGEPSGIQVESDASNSFAQLASVLFKSQEIAETCNIKNTYNEHGDVVIADLYGLVADRMSDIYANRKEINEASNKKWK